MGNTISSNATNTVGPSAEMKALLEDTTHGYANKFALIQLQLAKENYAQVTDIMEKVKKLQADQATLTKGSEEVNNFISGVSDAQQYIIISPELKKKIDESGITIYNLWDRPDKGVYVIRKKYWDNWINQLNKKINSLKEGSKDRNNFEGLKKMVNEQVTDKSIYYFSAENEKWSIPSAVQEFCKNNGITCPKWINGNGENIYSFEEMKAFAATLNEKLTSMQQNIDDNMTLMQTHLGQYNSYVEGAGKAYSDLSQVGQSIAKNL